MDFPVEIEVKPSLILTDAKDPAESWKELPCPTCRADRKLRAVTSSWGPEKITICTQCGSELGREAR